MDLRNLFPCNPFLRKFFINLTDSNADKEMPNLTITHIVNY